MNFLAIAGAAGALYAVQRFETAQLAAVAEREVARMRTFQEAIARGGAEAYRAQRCLTLIEMTKTKEPPWWFSNDVLSGGVCSGRVRQLTDSERDWCDARACIVEDTGRWLEAQGRTVGEFFEDAGSSLVGGAVGAVAGLVRGIAGEIWPLLLVAGVGYVLLVKR